MWKSSPACILWQVMSSSTFGRSLEYNDEQRVMAVFDMFGAYTADRPHAIDGGGNYPIDGQGSSCLAGFKTNADGGIRKLSLLK